MDDRSTFAFSTSTVTSTPLLWRRCFVVGPCGASGGSSSSCCCCCWRFFWGHPFRLLLRLGRVGGTGTRRFLGGCGCGLGIIGVGVAMPTVVIAQAIDNSSSSSSIIVTTRKVVVLLFWFGKRRRSILALTRAICRFLFLFVCFWRCIRGGGAGGG
jgi:hypothetical protein